MSLFVMIRKQILPLIAIVALSLSVAGAQRSPKTETKQALLPEAFAGWVQTEHQQSTDPAVADPAQAAALKEYGFKDFEQATYTRNGHKLVLRAARFQDATGAYGAFTFYRQPQMRDETIGTLAVSDNDRVLFFKDNVLVEARFDEITAMSAAELRDLSGDLPQLQGPGANLPTLPSYMPHEHLVENTGKYILGPVAYAATGIPLSAQLIDFSKSPEIITAQMKFDANTAVTMLVSYPTPLIAMEKLAAFQAANPNPKETYVVKRTGPIIAVTMGPISTGDAKSVLGRVNYEADVTWNENTWLSQHDNVGSLVVAAITLAIIIFVMSVGTGAMFGFGRVILQKIFPGRFKPKTDETEFIRLHLED